VISVPRVGQYQPLYTYLRERARQRVVLRFSEIEDLLGFKLPPASLDSTWWHIAEIAGVSSAQSNAWALAGRTATANMSARWVVFDRGTTSSGTRNPPMSRQTFIRRLSNRTKEKRSLH